MSKQADIWPAEIHEPEPGKKEPTSESSCMFKPLVWDLSSKSGKWLHFYSPNRNQVQNLAGDVSPGFNLSQNGEGEADRPRAGPADVPLTFQTSMLKWRQLLLSALLREIMHVKNDLQIFWVFSVKRPPQCSQTGSQNQCLMQLLAEQLVDVKGNNFVIQSTSAPLLSRLSKWLSLKCILAVCTRYPCYLGDQAVSIH